MDDYTPPPVGSMISVENTSDNADEIRDFYVNVLGWKVHPISMGDYDDYTMLNHEDGPVAGICFRRGPNQDIPAGWIPCFRVENVEQAISTAIAQGGKQIGSTRDFGESSQYAVIQDMNGSHISVMDFRDS